MVSFETFDFFNFKYVKSIFSIIEQQIHHA